jgi:predicted N-acetyltransferase YhbS
MKTVTDQNFTIKTNPSENEVIDLIEKSFHYPVNFSFKNDFSPLFSHHFNAKSFTLYDDKTLVAHIGLNQRELLLKEEKLQVIFLGGIAVHENYRGMGLFNNLIKHVLSIVQKECALLFLWSGDNVLYEKYGFIQTGQVHQWGALSFKPGENCVSKNLSALTPREVEEIKNLYEQSWNNRIIRTSQQWSELLKMKDVCVHLDYLSNKLQSYAFEGKGFDLQNIVHEFGAYDLNKFCREHHQQKIWSPPGLNPSPLQKLWLGLVKEGELWPWDESVASVLSNESIMIGGLDSV